MHCRIPQKIQILKFVAEQGIVSAQNVNRYFFSEDKINVIISTMYQLGLARMWYGNIYGGVWQIGDPKLYQLLRTYYPDLSGLKVRPIPMNLVPHYLEMNRIRAVFEKSGHFDIALWLSERLIQAIPVNQRSNICPVKAPDAVFWLMCKSGGQKKFFIECERHYNSTDKRYREMFETYSRRIDAKEGNVVYFCGSREIQRRLINIASKMSVSDEHLRFQLLEDFYNKYLTPPINREQKIKEEVSQEVVQDAKVEQMQTV